MWECKHKDGTIEKFSKYSRAERCPLCGQYLRQQEESYIIFPPHNVRTHKKLNRNFLVHCDEWDLFCEGITDDTALASKFIAHKMPRVKPLSNEEQCKLDAFIQACINKGFPIIYRKPYGAHCKRVGSSIYVQYNVFSDKIRIEHRGKRGLFDGFFEREIIAKIYNEMHTILGDEKVDDYNANTAISSVVEQVQRDIRRG